ncbi:MAG TPA: ATP-binding protein [Solirubrobacteraceae bacterium]|nr:ATP-binding protein [Solirubrobacteraceae bacterium]
MIAGRPMTELDAAGFWERFGRIEHEQLEFKVSANNLREVIPAMAMTRGGHIILGVTDDRLLVGCPLNQRTLDAIMRRARESGVDVDVQTLLVDGRRLTVVTVPEVTDRIVTTSDGRVLRRVGSDNVPLRGDELARLVRRRRRALLRKLPMWRTQPQAVKPC